MIMGREDNFPGGVGTKRLHFLLQFFAYCDLSSGEFASDQYNWPESDFRYDVILSRWLPWRHFTPKTAATRWLNSKRLASSSS